MFDVGGVSLAVLFGGLWAGTAWRLHAAQRNCRSAEGSNETQHLRLQAMLQSIGDGVVATDAEGRVIFLNRAAKTLLAMTDQDVGKKLSEISILTDEKGKHVPLERHPLHQCLKTHKKVVTKKFFFVRPGQFNLAMYISATPIVKKGAVLGAIEVFRDITKEKEVDKAKSEFVYLASHQLRTPLSTINWYLELLLSGDAGPTNKDQKEYLQQAYDSTKHMVGLVNEILDVSRLELGTFVSKKVGVDVRPIIKDCTDEVSAMLVRKHIKLVSKIPENIPVFLADPKLIRLIFQNLITNAVKYTPEKGAVRVTLALTDHKISITIADNGYGIPKAVQGKIFTKLFRADNVKEKEPSGTGLGLYTVKSVVEQQLGGTIRFESEENKGTTFFVTIPFKPAPAAKASV